MPSANTPLLGLALPITGDLSGSWGNEVNNAITSLLDDAVAGTTSITVDADITLTTTVLAANQARQAIILWNPAAGTTTRNITAPAQSKIYTVINASGGTQSIVFRGVGPTTGVVIVKGESAVIAWNGTDFIKVSNAGGSASFTNVTVSGTTTLSNLTASTALALDASKNVVSVTNTGTGNNVLATSPTLVTPALGTPSSVTLTNATGLPISTGVSGLGTDVATALAVNVGTAGSPVVNGGVLGTPSSGTLTNATGLPVSTGISGLGSGVATALAVNVGTAGSPVVNGGVLGTPSSGTLTNATGLPVATGISGLGTGVATALAVNVGSAGAPVINGGVLGTPSSGTLTNATGLPVSTGISGLGSGVATFLATPSSANLAAAVTDETGSGALVFATSPTLVTPALGTPASGVVTNLTGTASININGTVGATTPSTGAFTTLSTSGAVTLSGGTANGVAYLDASKVLTSGSALTFSGTQLDVVGSANIGSDAENALFINSTSTVVTLSSAGRTTAIDSSLSFATTASGVTTARARLDPLGNFKLGSGAPANWNSLYQALQVGPSAAMYSVTGNSFLLNNAYVAGDMFGDTPTYLSTNAASYYGQNSSGQHQWFTAPSGTAGNAITFTKKMELNSTGLEVTGTAAISGGVVARVNSQTTIASPWAWDSTLYDQQQITALANALTINADAGTPSNGQKTVFRFTDDGTARALTWTTGTSKSFRSVGTPLPTTTVASKTLYVACIYNSTAARWDVVAVAQET